MQSILNPPFAPPAAVVSARDLVRRYGSGDTAVDALRGVSVDIAEGRLTAVMGPSGSGKSTLMHILAGLDTPTSGEVTVAGVDIAGLGDDDLTKLRRDHIGFIFQFFNLLPMLTAAENIALPLKLAGVKPDRAWLDQVVESVGLTDRLKHRPSELSGGQQQRVAVARALVSRPTVMFADEPTGNLDSRTSGEILDAPARRRRHARPDDRDGHPRRARRGDRRPRAVPGRRAHRARPRPVHRPRDPRDPGSGVGSMIAVALKGLAGRKVRALLTAFAIVIGVSMVAGTFILTDTLQGSLTSLEGKSTSKTDVAIFEKEIVKGSQGAAVTIPASLLAKVQELPEVAEASGEIAPQKDAHVADIIGRDGRPAKGQSFGRGFDPERAHLAPISAGAFSPFKLNSGDWPEGSGQVVIDAHTAAEQHYKAGDTIEIATATGRHRFELSGTVGFLGEELPPRPSVAAWDIKTAQTVLDRAGRYDVISIAAKPGVSPERVLRAVQPLLPANLTAKGNAQAVKDAEKELNRSMLMVRVFLLGFAFIALLVGAFVIFNALSITVAQRTREFATLRTLGASRKQVMRSVRLEGLVLGLLASVIGLAIGLGVAQGMMALDRRARLRVPEADAGGRGAHGRHLADPRHRRDAARQPRAGSPRHARSADRRGARGRDAAADRRWRSVRTPPVSSSRGARCSPSRSARSAG